MSNYCSKSFLKAAIAVVVSSSAIAQHAAAATTFPGAAPCNTTLQACVTAAAAGDTIELATNALINEFVDTDKSLTLQPAAGFAPQLLGVGAIAKTADIDVTVTKLSMTLGVAAVCAGTGNLTLRVIQNSISAGNDDAISIRDGGGCTSGTKTAIISGNVITQAPDDINSAIVLEAVVTGFDATISDNDIALSGLNDGGGIILFSIDGHDASATIARNRIHGSNYDEGIELRNDGPGGVLTALIFDNLIAGQNGNAGGPGSIAIDAGGTNAAIDATIVNNTIVDGRNAMNIGVRDDLGATFTGAMINNIVARNSEGGVGVRNTPTGFTNSNNLFFANGSGNSAAFIPGPGTRFGDPAFADPAAGDYSLTASSDAIDHGRSAAAPSGLDLAGNPRVQGTAVDIGALESPFAVAAPLRQAPALNPPSLLALLGLVLGAGMMSLRRSRLL